MKTWWTTKGWPWLKGNWWVLLILPVMLLVGLGMLVMRLRMPPAVIDPTAAADARAKLEAETRANQLEAERDVLAEQLTELRAERDALKAHFEQRLVDEVQALRDDPERLRELMLATGRGQ